MGVPDKKVIRDIGGYRFKKARTAGEIFVTSPEGVNTSFNVEVFQEFLKELEGSKELREKFDLE